MSVEKLASELEVVLTKRIQSDQLVLPTMPAVALKVSEILKDPDAGMKEVAAALEKDPVLSARALRMATSAAFASGGKKATLQEALARDIMALSGQTDSEAAYLAGLLHDVGKPIVAAVLLEAERQMTELYNRAFIDSGDWLEVVGRVHRPVGVSLADKWQLPDAVSKCVKESTEYDNSDRNSLVNAVCFANALSKKIGIYAGPVAEEDNDALVMIGRSLIGISDDVLKTLTQGLRERVTGLYD